MNTNQCAHTVDTYKLVSNPPEKKKEAQPRQEKSMEKTNRYKKILQKIRKLKAAKNKSETREKQEGAGGER